MGTKKQDVQHKQEADGYKKLEFEKDDMMPNAELIRFDPDLRFAFHYGSGQIRAMFKSPARNFIITKLEEKFGLKNLRENKYGDIIIIKNG